MVFNMILACFASFVGGTVFGIAILALVSTKNDHLDE